MARFGAVNPRPTPLDVEKAERYYGYGRYFSYGGKYKHYKKYGYYGGKGKKKVA